TPTAEDLQSIVVAEQLDALREEALGDTQGDPFAAIAPAIVAEVRAYIASNPANVVDADTTTIPPELKLRVLYMILGPMLGRLGIALTEDQRKQLDIAHSTLVALREKKLVVSKPDDAIAPEVQSPGGVEAVDTTACRKF